MNTNGNHQTVPFPDPRLRRLKHYRKALELTDLLRRSDYRDFIAEGEVPGERVHEPGYRETRRGTLKRIIARLEAQLAG